MGARGATVWILLTQKAEVLNGHTDMSTGGTILRESENQVLAEAVTYRLRIQNNMDQIKIKDFKRDHPADDFPEYRKLSDAETLQIRNEPMTSGHLKVPEVGYPDSSSISWIPSKGSILFSVPIKQLEPGLMIYVPFQYEWELSRQLIFNKEPEHRVYFRGVDLTARRAD